MAGKVGLLWVLDCGSCWCACVSLQLDLFCKSTESVNETNGNAYGMRRSRLAQAGCAKAPSKQQLDLHYPEPLDRSKKLERALREVAL